MSLFSSVDFRTVCFFLFATHLNTTINLSRTIHTLQIVCVVWPEISVCGLLCVCNFTRGHQLFSCHCLGFALELRHAPFCCHPHSRACGWKGTFWNLFLAENAQRWFIVGLLCCMGITDITLVTLPFHVLNFLYTHFFCFTFVPFGILFFFPQMLICDAYQGMYSIFLVLVFSLHSWFLPCDLCNTWPGVPFCEAERKMWI